MASLYDCIDRCIENKRIFIADPILDPINYGFTQSITRYSELRKRYPDILIMMGTVTLIILTVAMMTMLVVALVFVGEKSLDLVARIHIKD